MKRRLAILFSVWLIMLTGCSTVPQTAPPGTASGKSAAATIPALSEPVQVKIAAFPGSFASLPVFVAESMGYFKNHKLTLSIVNVGGGVQAGQALASGAVEFALVAIEGAISLNEQGMPVQLVVGGVTKLPFTLVVANQVNLPRAGEGYPNMVKDLKGMRLGITSKGSSTDYVLRWLLQEAGLNPEKDVQIVVAGLQAEATAAMENGQIDGYVTTEPATTVMTKIRKVGKPALAIFKGEGPPLLTNYMLNGIGAKKAYVGANPAVAKAMYSAIADASAYIKTLKDPAKAKEAAELLQKYYSGVDKAVLADILMNATDLYDPKITPAMVENATTLTLSFKLASQKFDFDTLVWSQP